LAETVKPIDFVDASTLQSKIRLKNKVTMTDYFKNKRKFLWHAHVNLLRKEGGIKVEKIVIPQHVSVISKEKKI